MLITPHQKDINAVSVSQYFSRGKMGDVNLDALASDLGFVLKSEQKETVEEIFLVYCVLPTGFGKSLIFQLFVLEKTELPTRQMLSVERPTIIVFVCLVTFLCFLHIFD